MIRIRALLRIPGASDGPARVLRQNDYLKGICVRTYSASNHEATVLSQDAAPPTAAAPPPPPLRAPAAPPPSAPPPPPPPNPPRSNRVLAFITAITFTSLGGIYLFKKMSPEQEIKQSTPETEEHKRPAAEPVPARAELLPERAQFLVAGGGTAAFSALRAIRSARPDAHVLLVSPERALPYMRPPLTCELWREPDLARAALRPHALAFRQWNGRRRALLYEPPAFYTPPDRLRDAAPGAAVALGWRLRALDPAAHTATLESSAGERAVLAYDKCLLATGTRPRRLEALSEAAAAGRSVAMHSLDDVATLAALVDAPGPRTVLVVGGGKRACELSAALAERVRAGGGRVVQVYREEAPLAGSLPPYLAAQAARALRELGVAALAGSEVVAGAVERGGRVRVRTARGEEVAADAVVECVGDEPDVEAARAARLETHPTLGGVVVNGELQARTDVWAAGDVACYYDETAGRRRVERHDHEVVSGRLAGENMAAAHPPRVYTHQSMFWSDIGPRLGYEAIGEIDSKLQTVGVFCEDAVQEVGEVAVAEGAGAAAGGSGGSGGSGGGGGRAGERQYERGVVFYLRERRVVGVLLWNLFNRMHVARQVLAGGQFDDLLEVAKLFSLHEEEE